MRPDSDVRYKPGNTERCVVCDEQYCDYYRDGWPDEPVHEECE